MANVFLLVLFATLFLTGRPGYCGATGYHEKGEMTLGTDLDNRTPNERVRFALQESVAELFAKLPADTRLPDGSLDAALTAKLNELAAATPVRYGEQKVFPVTTVRDLIESVTFFPNNAYKKMTEQDFLNLANLAMHMNGRAGTESVHKREDVERLLKTILAKQKSTALMLTPVELEDLGTAFRLFKNVKAPDAIPYYYTVQDLKQNWKTTLGNHKLPLAELVAILCLMEDRAILNDRLKESRIMGRSLSDIYGK